MDENLSQSTESGLSYHNVLPLAWSEITAGQDNILERFLPSNEALLNTLNDLEDHHVVEHADEHSLVMQEMARLERKVNLVLNMLGQLLSRQQEMPPAVPVVIALDGMQWEGARIPAKGAHIELGLYLSREYPMPLVLSGVVTDITPGDHGETRVSVKFDTLPDSVENSLGKLIFRHHRRTIASARRPTQ